jgi:O-antigen/teichoic acid export membrane protein
LTIGSKFCFTFFLGKEYPEELLGEYGLFSTTILLCYFILSLSFESYGLREIVQKPVEYHLTYIRNLFLFYLISYAVFFPLTFLIFHFDILSYRLILFFLILLFLETSAQTFFVLFAIIQRSVAANIVLFFSQGFWIMFVFIFWYFDLFNVNALEQFLLVWIGGSAMANVYGYVTIRKIYKNFAVDKKIDWRWITKGLTISMIFFWSTLAYKLIEFSDRYIIELKLGTIKLGVYVFYSQIANLVNTVINVIVILILYPKLIENYVKHDLKAFVIIKNKMYNRIAILGISISLVEVILIQFMLDFLDKSSFRNELWTFYVLLGGNILMNLSFVPHYCLYALRKDMVILYSTVFGSLLNIVLNLVLIPAYGILGAAIATLASLFFVWLWKALYLKKSLKQVVNNSSSL